MKRTLLLAMLVALVMPVALKAQKFSDFQTISKENTNIILHQRLSDVCYMDVVRLAGPPKAVQTKKSCEFLDSLKDNQLKFYSYVFIPKTVEQGKKYPLIVLSHGGIHGTFGTTFIHILREILAQGYIVVAPDYRGVWVMVNRSIKQLIMVDWRMKMCWLPETIW